MFTVAPAEPTLGRVAGSTRPARLCGLVTSCHSISIISKGCVTTARHAPGRPAWRLHCQWFPKTAPGRGVRHGFAGMGAGAPAAMARCRALARVAPRTHGRRHLPGRSARISKSARWPDAEITRGSETCITHEHRPIAKAVVTSANMALDLGTSRRRVWATCDRPPGTVRDLSVQRTARQA